MNGTLEIIPIQEVKPIHIYGRTTKNHAPLSLFWTGSGIEVNISGSEMWIEAEATYLTHEPWISISVNDEVVTRQMILKGKHLLPVFRGMDKNQVKNIKIIKETQAMSADTEHCLQILSIHTDGEFYEIKPKKSKIEFIGDSITSGEGSIGAKQETDWIPMFFSARNTYAFQAAQMLNADFRVISQSGWGVVSSWDNNPHHNIPEYYEQICGIVKGERYEVIGAHEKYDFISWQPDVVVINLGTNDDAAFHNPEWKDEVTGETFKQSMLDEDTYEPQSTERFMKAITDFLKKIRKYNGAAHIIWAYGMVGDALFPYIKEAVERYRSDTGDQKVDVIKLTEVNDKTMGARNHPGVLCHKQAAEQLSKFILSSCISAQ